MSNYGEFRPIPPRDCDTLPGHRDPHAYIYVAHGADCVMLCAGGDVARWRNAIAFTSDEARRLGMQLMAQADAAEDAAEEIAERDRMIASDDITAIMTELGCSTTRTRRLSGVLKFRDAMGALVTVTQEGNFLRIERWSRERETQLTDERGFRKAAEAILRQ